MASRQSGGVAINKMGMQPGNSYVDFVVTYYELSARQRSRNNPIEELQPLIAGLSLGCGGWGSKKQQHTHHTSVTQDLSIFPLPFFPSSPLSLFLTLPLYLHYYPLTTTPSQSSTRGKADSQVTSTQSKAPIQGRRRGCVRFISNPPAPPQLL